jgi:hypothetical protein
MHTTRTPTPKRKLPLDFPSHPSKKSQKSKQARKQLSDLAPRASFLRLPRELRNKIYQLLLPGASIAGTLSFIEMKGQYIVPLHIHYGSSSSPPSRLPTPRRPEWTRTSRLVRREAVSELYHNGIVLLSSDEPIRCTPAGAANPKLRGFVDLLRATPLPNRMPVPTAFSSNIYPVERHLDMPVLAHWVMSSCLPSIFGKVKMMFRGD